MSEVEQSEVKQPELSWTGQFITKIIHAKGNKSGAFPTVIQKWQIAHKYENVIFSK